MREVAGHAAGGTHAAMDEGKIDFADGLRGKLRADGVVGGLVAGGDHEARRAGVDAVDDAGLERIRPDGGGFGVAGE